MIDGAMPVEIIHRLTDASDATATMTIAEVGELLGMSPHTLRYYERAGLVQVDRDQAGHRTYDAEARRRLVFVTRMRLSGMPIRNLQRYVVLADGGAATESERLRMLTEYRDTIRRQIRELQLSLAATDYKIASYRGEKGWAG